MSLHIEQVVETPQDLINLLEKIIQQVPPAMALKAFSCALGFCVAGSAKDEKDSAASVVTAAIMQAISSCATMIAVENKHKFDAHLPRPTAAYADVAEKILDVLRDEFHTQQDGMQQAASVLAVVAAAAVSTTAQALDHDTVHTVALDFISLFYDHMRRMHEQSEGPQSVRGWRHLTESAIAKAAENERLNTGKQVH